MDHHPINTSLIADKHNTKHTKINLKKQFTPVLKSNLHEEHILDILSHADWPRRPFN